MNLENLKVSDDSSRIIFITGGTKSGKSEFAEYLANTLNNLTYIALSEKRKKDKNWEKKILIHKERRPKNWDLIETSDILSTLKLDLGPILIDSIGGFVMESIDKNDEEWLEKTNLLIELLLKRNSPSLIVGEQVGWSLVSEYEIGNTFIERIGLLQKVITKISKDNWLTINGRAIKIDELSLEIPL